MERYRLLGAECAAVIESVAASVEPDMTECEAASVIALGCRRGNINPVVLMAAGEERIRAWRHPMPKEAPLGRYAMLVVCGRRHGLGRYGPGLAGKTFVDRRPG